MPDRVVALDEQGMARLGQVLLGLAEASTLPDADVYVDPEGTPVARREGGALVALRDPGWLRPDEVRLPGRVAVAVAGRLPADSALKVPVLLPLGAVRPDDARGAAWRAAWHAAAAAVIEVPVPPAEAEARADELAARYAAGGRAEVDTVTHPRGEGRTVFFTGLSGSGKSTIARALAARVGSTRSVSLLDGDVVRTHLSAGLGFSRADRDTNIRRIGWVAAEVTKHGGIAVCAPIAPYDETRKWVRATVDAAGGPGSFVLVWVSTPIEVCEARDVKGLYARARAGELTGFTGVDDPYESPGDAELSLDTSVLEVEECVDRVEQLLRE
jgi:sulfate adenylyltransferase